MTSRKAICFEKLYRDLANYRDDFVFANITRRVLTDLIRLFDRVDALVEEDSVAHLQREDILDHVRSFRSEILQALRRQEVSIIDDGPGSFDEMVQEAVDVAAVPRREDDQEGADGGEPRLSSSRAPAAARKRGRGKVQ